MSRDFHICKEIQNRNNSNQRLSEAGWRCVGGGVIDIWLAKEPQRLLRNAKPSWNEMLKRISATTISGNKRRNNNKTTWDLNRIETKH